MLPSAWGKKRTTTQMQLNATGKRLLAYVRPQWRSGGIGRRLVAHAVDQWPAAWNRVFLYARSENVERYRRWGFAVVPGHGPRFHRPGLGAPPGLIVQMIRWRDQTSPG